MNPKNDYLRDYLGITAWHKAGYTGSRGLTASGEDFTSAAITTHKHRTYDEFKEVAPDRRVIYLPMSNPDNLITEATVQGVDSMFVSISTQAFQSADRKKVDEGLPERMTLLVAAGNDGDEKANVYMRAERIYGVGAAQLIVSSMSSGVPAANATFTLMPASYSSVSETVDFSSLTDWRLIEGAKEHTFTGTSCACPVLCGIAALINDMAIYKTGKPLTDKGVIQALKDISVDMNTEGHDNKTGWGIPILPPPDQFDIFKYQEGVTEMVYNDDDNINPVHKEDVYRAYELGLMSGHEGCFNPKASLSREEEATVAVREYDIILAEVNAVLQKYGVIDK